MMKGILALFLLVCLPLHSDTLTEVVEHAPLSLDPIDVARFVAGLLINQRLASIVGPYTVILLAAMAGAGTALGNLKEPLDRWKSFWYFMRAVLGALLVTVPASTFLVTYRANWEAQWFFIPLAIVIAYFGDKWRHAMPFLLKIAKSGIEAWVSKGAPKGEDK